VDVEVGEEPLFRNVFFFGARLKNLVNRLAHDLPDFICNIYLNFMIMLATQGRYPRGRHKTSDRDTGVTLSVVVALGSVN